MGPRSQSVGRSAIALVSLIMLLSSSLQAKSHNSLERKSLVFDLKTPKVFYCPQEKPADLEKLIVKARPLDKLCEFDGKAKPKDFARDCYNDLDETDFACDEKKRFMIKLELANEYDTITDRRDDLEFISTEGSGKLRKSHSKEKIVYQ